MGVGKSPRKFFLRLDSMTQYVERVGRLVEQYQTV